MKALMQHWAADCTTCEMCFMLSLPISTAAATRAVSATTSACPEASTPLHYVVQKSYASDWMAMTHAIRTDTGNEATIAEKSSPRSKIAGIVNMWTRPACSTCTHLCCCGQCKLRALVSRGSHCNCQKAYSVFPFLFISAFQSLHAPTCIS